MTYVLVAAIAAVVAAVVAATATAVVATRRASFGGLVKATVIVQLTTETGFRGVLWSMDRRMVVLRRADMLGAGDPVPVDGDVIVDRDRVEFIQKVA